VTESKDALTAFVGRDEWTPFFGVTTRSAARLAAVSLDYPCSGARPAQASDTGPRNDASGRGRAAKRAARKAATAALREKVFARPGPDCELGQHGWPRYDVEMHHLVAGSAKRVTEDVSNTLRACTTCHRGWHQDGPLPFVATVKQWAALHSFPLPSIIRKAEASAQLPGRAAR
jgi:hypothetical protein